MNDGLGMAFELKELVACSRIKNPRRPISRCRQDTCFIAVEDCRAYAFPIVSVGVQTVSGRAEIGLQIPNNVALVGGTSFWQWSMLDWNANGLGLITSNAAEIRIGIE